MAIAFDITYTVSDNDGDQATTTVKVPTTFTLSDYGEFGAAMAELIDDIIEGRVDAADLCLSADLAGLVGNVAVGGSDVEEIAAFQFLTSDNRAVNVNIPAMSEAIVGAGSDDLNQADPLVAPFITAMESGISVTGGTITPCDIGEDDIVSTKYAREKFRASGSRR